MNKQGLSWCIPLPFKFKQNGLVSRIAIIILAFPNEPPNNFLVFIGMLAGKIHVGGYPIKIILPSNYPIHPPKVYFNMNLSIEIVKRVGYIGEQNSL